MQQHLCGYATQYHGGRRHKFLVGFVVAVVVVVVVVAVDVVVVVVVVVVWLQ